MSSGVDQSRSELQAVLQAIGETHGGSSWPYGLEIQIEDWIKAGDERAPPQFDDRQGIVTSSFFQRLRKLRRQSNGWYYFDNAVTFFSKDQWTEKRALIISEWEARRFADNLRTRRLERLREIVQLARADARFWEAARQDALQVLQNMNLQQAGYDARVPKSPFKVIALTHTQL